MSRRSRISATLCLGFAMLIGLTWAAVLGRTRTVSVGDDVTMLQTRGLLGPIGANVVVVTDVEASLVVDAQLGPLGRRIQTKLSRLGGGPTRYLVNTHWHPDHTGGNESIQVGGEIVAHASVRTRRSSPQEGFSLTKPGSHHDFSPLPGPALPSRFIDQRAILTVGDIAVEVRHFPAAHTDGDLAVYVPSAGVVIVGDLVWPGSFPFIDTPTGGTAAGLAGALDDLVAWVARGTSVVPGHGDVMSYEEFLDYRQFVHDATEAVGRLRDRGESLGAAQGVGLPQEFERWSSRLVPTEEWIRMVYGSTPDGAN